MCFFYLAPFFLESKSKGFSKGWTSANPKNPWMTMIFNNMFVVWVLYCVQLFFFFKRFFAQNNFLLSPAIAFVPYLVQVSRHPHHDFYGVSMEILCTSYGVSLIFYGVSKGVSMVVLWDSYGVSKGCLWVWYFYDMFMGFLWDVHDISFGLLWDLNKTMVFLWNF